MYPRIGMPHPLVFNVNDPEASVVTLGGRLDQATGGTYPVANRAYFFPFRVFHPILITALYMSNGATISGNFDLGIYDINGNKKVTTGSTAQAAPNNTAQVIDITDTWLQPGGWYFAISSDATTGTVFRSSLTANLYKQSGVLQMSSAFPLPDPATMVATSDNYIPNIGWIRAPRTTLATFP